MDRIREEKRQFCGGVSDPNQFDAEIADELANARMYALGRDVADRIAKAIHTRLAALTEGEGK